MQPMLLIRAQAGDRFQQAEPDLLRQRVQVLGPVEGQDGDAVFDGFEQVGHGHFSATIESRISLAGSGRARNLRLEQYQPDWNA